MNDYQLDLEDYEIEGADMEYYLDVAHSLPGCPDTWAPEETETDWVAM